jgi:SlyX protein
MTPQSSEANAKIEALEMRIAHQDRVISDLNEIVTDHWRRIEVLERLVKSLREEILNFGRDDAANERPPHY